MELHNIALIRATNVIPFDGVIKPISNTPYLYKDINSDLAIELRKMLSSLMNQNINNKQYYSESEMKKNNNRITKLVKEYIPYTSHYNSYVLFSINGVVPDDSIHNVSSKKCIIIEPLEDHIHDVVSLIPNETAIQGNVYLSKESLILIDENEYKLLSNEEKTALHSLPCHMQTFKGNTQDVTKEVLLESNRYSPETLTRDSLEGEYLPSITSDALMDCLHKTAKEYHKLEKVYWNLSLQNDEEWNNDIYVQNYYLQQFYQYALLKMNDSKKIIYEVPNNMHDKYFFLQPFLQYIHDYHLNRYRDLVKEYNEQLENQKKSGELLTPEQIVHNRIHLYRR